MNLISFFLTVFAAHCNGYTATIDLDCDNSIYLYKSDDGFATYDTYETGETGGNWHPPNAVINDITANSVIRIGCWNYGGPGYLQADVSVDGTTYTLDGNTVNNLYELVGWEKVNENDGNWVTTPQPDISNIAALKNPSNVALVQGLTQVINDGYGPGFWPADMVNRQGVIWVDFDFSNVVTPEDQCDMDPRKSATIDLDCDNSIYLYKSDDGFATYDTYETGETGGNWHPPNAVINDINANSVIRIGCWNYGGPGYLQADVSVDGTTYTLDGNTVNNLYELVGWEKVNENDGNWVTTPQPDISNIAALKNPSNVALVQGLTQVINDGYGPGFWPADMVNRQGVIWVDFDFGNVVTDECDDNCLDKECVDDDGCPFCMQCCKKRKVCEYPKSQAMAEMDVVMNNGGHINKYNYSMYDSILLVGVILFILINNVFICYWCLCKKHGNNDKLYMYNNKV